MTTTRPLVLVLVGTDVHAFDRVVGWADALATRGDLEVLVQHGASSPPGVADGIAYLDPEDLSARLTSASAVVTHGGPGTIADARRHGHRPVTVARDPSLGEHVDDHQQLYTRRLARHGDVDLVDDAAAFVAAVDSAVGRGPARTADGAATPVVGPPATPPQAAVKVRDLARAHACTTGAWEQSADLRVLYIGGLGRSGTTLLERMIASLPGFVGAGELVHLWSRGLVKDERCGCGEHFSACPFWTEVGRRAFGSWDDVDGETVGALQASVDRTRYVPLLRHPRLGRELQSRRAEYAVVLSQLLRGIRDASGASVVVDSSKHASTAHLVAALPGVDMRLVHVVRDPRAVAHSWAKTVARPDSDGTDEMARWAPPRTSVQWVAQNGLLDGLPDVPRLRLRHEDVVADPRAALRAVLRLMGEPDDVELPGVDDDGVDLAVQHSVSGNPMRFTTGRVRLRRDEAWRESLPARGRTTVDVLTAPLARRYGYGPLRRRRP